MTVLGLLALGCAVLGLVRGRPALISVALGFGAGVPASAGLVVAGFAVPVFTCVGLVAAVAWAFHRRVAPAPKVAAVLVAFTAWSIGITLVAPSAFAGVPVLSPRGGVDQQVHSPAALEFAVSNVAQSGYLVIAVLVVLFLVRSGTATTALWATAWTGIGLSTVRNVLRSTGTDVLAPVFDTMTAAYAVAGDARLRGVFTEPSELATFALPVAVIAIVSAANGRGRAKVAPTVLAGLAVANLVGSASGTAVAAAAIVLGLGLVVLVGRSVVRDGRGVAWLVLGGITLASATIAFGSALVQPALALVADKVGSQSYDSRTAADAIGWQVSADTMGIGAGLGSNRSSSFVITLLSTVGVPGTLLFAVVVVMLVATASRRRSAIPALAGLIALLVAKSIAAPDLSTPLLWMCIAACVVRVAVPTTDRKSQMPTTTRGLVPRHCHPMTTTSAAARFDGTFRGVQALRFVAALLVVLAHVPSYLRDRLGATTPDFGTGAIGVPVFFAISGFVAVLVTQRRPAPGWGDFMRRRVIRVVPLAWMLTTVKLLVAVVAVDSLQRATVSPGYVTFSYLFLPSRGSDGIVQPLYTVNWTLAFEMAFYALVAVALALRIDPIRLAVPVFALAAAGSAFRGDDWPAWQFYADPLVLCFLVGMLIGRWTRDGETAKTAVQLGLVLALWLAVVLPVDPTLPHVIVLPVAIVALWGVVALEPSLRRFVGPPLLTLGDASYALYLTHPLAAPAAVAVAAAVGEGGMPPLLVGGVAVLVAVAVSVAVWFVIDQPLTKTLQRLTRPGAGRRRASDTSAGRA